MADSRPNLPQDAAALAEHLKGISGEQLAAIEAQLVTEFDELYGDGTDADLDLARLQVLTEQITAVRSETTVRNTEAAERAKQATDLRNAIHATTPEGDGDAEGTEGDADPGDGAEGDGEAADGQEEALVQPLAASIARAIDAAVTRSLTMVTAPKAELVLKDGPGLNRHLRLGAVSQHAPDANVPASRPGTVFTASADIPGFVQGGAIPDMTKLVDAMHSRARNLPISVGGGQRVPVASMARDFRYKLDLDASPAQINEVLTAAMDVEALVAAGGWCAPSEIMYDFFNIVCEDGMLDLPTVGVTNRGGIRFPTSPAFNDIITGSPDGLWTWTETDDQAAVTGGGTPIKDCVRVLCPSFTEQRLVCDGLCVTAGNLIDYAYPESVANFLRLIMAARAHLTNARVINLLVAASTAVTMAGPTGGFTGNLFNAIEFQATDYRNRFAMCDDAILEVVLPQWADGALRSDYMRRTGIDDPNLTDALINAWFDARDVRVQFVQDYQVRSTGKPGNPSAMNTDWPATIEFMIYAPGTFVRGQGLRLDLGVVRDSTLNATNDHTAAWMEDCYLVAKVGHESRKVTATISVAGTTGAANIT